MIESLRNMARSRFLRNDGAADYVALDWEPGRLRIVAAHLADGQLRLIDSFETDWSSEAAELEDPAATAEQLKQLLRGFPVRAPRALVVLPRDAVVVRRLDLPSVPDTELPDLVRLQAATKLATPVERLALDFLPLPIAEDRPGRSVLLASIDQDRLQKLVTALEAAGLQPTGCTTSITTVAGLALRSAPGGPPAGLTLVIYQHRQRLELSAVFAERSIFSYSTTLPELDAAGHTQPLTAELSRVLVAVRQVHHEAGIDRVLLIQDGERDEQVLATLQQRFGERLQVLDRDDLRRGAQLDSPWPADASAAALGAIAAEAFPQLPALDFLRPRQAVAAGDPRRRRLILAAASAAVVLVIAGLTYYGMLTGRDREIARLEGERARLGELLNSPEARSTLAAAEALDAWSQTATPPLEVVSRFQELLPGTDRLYLTDLRLTPQAGDAVAQLTAGVAARQRRDLLDLTQRLVEAGYRVKPQTITIDSRRDPDYPFTFQLDVQVPPQPRDGSATVAALPGEPAAAVGTHRPLARTP